MNNFLFAADLHLQPCAWVGRQSLRGDSYFALDQIKAAAVKYACPIILGGDIFDSPRPDSESAERFRRFVTEVESGGGEVFHIDGNHDTADPSWATILGSKKIRGLQTVGGVAVYGLDYTPRSRLKEELQKVPAHATLICHQAWKELDGGAHSDGSLMDCPCLFILAGDLHKTIKAQCAKMAFSPGSTCMQSIDESPQKYIIHFQHGGDTAMCANVPILSRAVVRMKAMTEEALSTVCRELQVPPERLELLPEELRTPIAAVEYDPMLPRAGERLQWAAADRWNLFLVARGRGVDDVIVRSPIQTSQSSMEVFAAVAQAAAPQDADALLELVRAATGSRQQAEAFLKDRRTQFLSVPGQVSWAQPVMAQ